MSGCGTTTIALHPVQLRSSCGRQGKVSLCPKTGSRLPLETQLMDLEHIKTLTDLMVANDLSEIMIRDGENRIVLRRGGRLAPQVVMTPAPVQAQAPAPAPAGPPPAAPPAPTQDPGLVAIKSPMVGTVYVAADPESPAFVKIGDRVNPNTIVCIIEAMKVFNEIKADVSGVVESIEVSNAKAVEYGQVLFKVRPG